MQGVGYNKAGRNSPLVAGAMACMLILLLFTLARITPRPKEAPASPPAQSQTDKRPVTFGEALNPTKHQVGPSYGQAHPWNPKVDPDWAPNDGFLADLRALMLPLILTCLLVWGTLKGLAALAPGVFGKSSASEPLLKVLETQRLSHTHSISLVEVAGKILVVGMTEQAMNPLCELTTEELEAARPLKVDTTESGDPPQSYKEILRHYASILPGMGVKK